MLNYVDLPVLDIHGRQKQQKRTNTFYEFVNAVQFFLLKFPLKLLIVKKKGSLLCTDVAARGLDIPDVDWIIQYDPPDGISYFK